MFQTFTGSSRRPRQVNLGGRNSNPFAAVGQAGPGSQSALANAQQDRERRQKERERQTAALTIQRTWRGTSSRRDVMGRLRQQWDQDAQSQEAGFDKDRELEQLRRLLQFFSPSNVADVRRLQAFATVHLDRIAPDASASAGGPWPILYLRLSDITLTTCERLSQGSRPFDEPMVTLLRLLSFLSGGARSWNKRGAIRYFTTIRVLTESLVRFADLPIRQTDPQPTLSSAAVLLVDATIRPLRNSHSATLDVYEAFACCYLTSPSLLQQVYYEDMLPLITKAINFKSLSAAMAAVLNSADFHGYDQLTNPSSQLPLLSIFIYIHRRTYSQESNRDRTPNQDYITVVSTLLSALADKVDLEKQPSVTARAEDFDRRTPRKLLITNIFVEQQLRSLVHQESISSLLGSTDRHVSQEPGEAFASARKLAAYALPLLMFFPKQAGDIREWLFRGFADSNIPPVTYFWLASKDTRVFRSISKDSSAVVPLLKAGHSGVRNSQRTSSFGAIVSENMSDEWRVILLFLEMYTIGLIRTILTGDDELFSAAQAGSDGSIGSTETNNNALPLEAVKTFITFLKNLGFALYFDAARLLDDLERDASVERLSSHFSVASPEDIMTMQARSPQGSSPLIAGISGMTLDYMKSLVTGLLRRIYVRDSRRRFLPKDHWLLTSHLDMESFIPAVVAEYTSYQKAISETPAEILDEHSDDPLDSDEDNDAPHHASPLVGNTRIRQTQHQERLRRQQRKLSEKRFMQAVAPRLEILHNMPFVIPFHTRVLMFRELVHMDKVIRRNGLVDDNDWRALAIETLAHPQRVAANYATVRRGHEFEDAYHEFYHLGDRLKEPIQIGFVDQFGEQEAGIDGGGVTKEFLTSVTRQAFSHPTDGIKLFLENDNHLLYPNPTAIEEKEAQLNEAGLREDSSDFQLFKQDLLKQYEFLGRVIGKCLYEGILVDINFAGFFLLKWALAATRGESRKSGYQADINDLRELDEALYQGLLKLKNYNGNVEDFSLDFTITDTVEMPDGSERAISKNLVLNGSALPVTNFNRLNYILEVAKHRLIHQPSRQTTAFLNGLSDIITPWWLRMFNQSELQTLIGGTSSGISISDLRANTEYGGVYQVGDDGLLHPTIELFWRVLEGLEDHERRAVLKFVTSTPNAPLLGFRTLQPRFSIRDSGTDQNRLPSTSTCVNLLKLPRYATAEVLKERLMYAAFSGAGFDLS